MVTVPVSFFEHFEQVFSYRKTSLLGDCLQYVLFLHESLPYSYCNRYYKKGVLKLFFFEQEGIEFW